MEEVARVHGEHPALTAVGGLPAGDYVRDDLKAVADLEHILIHEIAHELVVRVSCDKGVHAVLFVAV